MHNAADYAKIVIISFIGIFLINKALEKSGLTQYKA